MTPADRLKADAITGNVREAIRMVYGTRLSDWSVNRAVDNLFLEETTVVTIKSNYNQLPTDRDGWAMKARALVDADSWLKSNVISSDKKLRDELIAEFTTHLSPARAMTLYRSGVLDKQAGDYADSHIQARLEQSR